MNRTPSFQPSLAALRPWPFGPPLRGRAPRGEAGLGAAHRPASPARLTAASDHSSSVQATAPVGVLACSCPIYSA
jgi:hypothetical protein